ncbi:hypothetical protein [Enterococcus sp.]|uniref:hypothetical protein n=1 Tax=Enterococcus sp. TaxID=35783 RepID=UPI0028AC54BB|nr:hypothetical protein [Enterococcus sp.]
MKSFVIACSVNEENKEISRVISTCSPNILKLHQYLWIVKSDLTPYEIVDRINKVIDVPFGEKVFVCELTNNFDASVGTGLIEGILR